MAKLTDKQELFAKSYVVSGGKKQQSARAAGYAHDSAHVEANRLLHLPHIQQRIVELQKEQFIDAAPAAFVAMVELANQTKSALVRFNAAKDIMDRAGFRPPEKGMDITASLDLNETDMRERIETLMSELYPSTPKVIDVTPASSVELGETTVETSDDLPAYDVLEGVHPKG